MTNVFPPRFSRIIQRIQRYMDKIVLGLGSPSPMLHVCWNIYTIFFRTIDPKGRYNIHQYSMEHLGPEYPHVFFFPHGYPLVNKQFVIEDGPVERVFYSPIKNDKNGEFPIVFWIFLYVYQRLSLRCPSISPRHPQEIVSVHHDAGDREREGFALISLAQHLLRCWGRDAVEGWFNVCGS